MDALLVYALIFAVVGAAAVVIGVVRKYKKGLIELMDIPAPIYESAEDKKEKEKLVRDAYNLSDSPEEVAVND